MMSLTQIAQNRKQQARAAFIEAAWSEEPPERLAELANDAGIEPPAADAIIGRIARVRADVAATGTLTRLRRTAAKTKALATTTRTNADSQIARLESEAATAEAEADYAQRELNVAEAAAREVLVAFDEGLLPASRLPKEVSELMDRRSLERKASEAEAIKCAAFNHRDRLRDELEGLERDLRTLPVSRDRQEQEARLKAEIERVKAALAAAETRLRDAERAHAKARNVL